MAKFCGECGSRVNETALFCGSCGKKIPVATAASAQPIYTPPPASWQSVPATDVPPSAAAEVPWAPVPAADPTPPPPADPASWQSVPAADVPASATAEIPWASVPAAGPTPPPITPDPATWAQVPPAYTAPPPAAQVPAAFTPAPAAAYTPPAAYPPVTAYPAKKSNTLLKVIIAVVVLLCVGLTLALAGLYYAARKVSQKAHQIAAQARAESHSSTPGGLADLLSGSSSTSGSAGDFKGDPCRFLSKAAVSQAVGIPVIRSDAKDGGCSYIAKGDPAEVTAKHAAMMLGDMGADAQTQKTIQKFAGALFAQDEAKDKNLSAEASTGEIPVLVVSFTAGNAQTEMKMNRGAFARLGSSPPSTPGNAAHPATGDLTGIGDEAYVVGGSMLMLRKGNTVARFTYISCPCNTNNIKPLAEEVASQL